MPYRPLIVWLRINDQTTFMSLVATYTESVRGVYRREIRQFRELAEKRFEVFINQMLTADKLFRTK